MVGHAYKRDSPPLGTDAFVQLGPTTTLSPRRVFLHHENNTFVPALIKKSLDPFPTEIVIRNMRKNEMEYIVDAFFYSFSFFLSLSTNNNTRLSYVLYILCFKRYVYYVVESRQFLFPNTFFLSLQRNINLEKDFVISNSKFYCCESNIKEFSSLQKKNCIKNWIISLWISSRKRERERERHSLKSKLNRLKQYFVLCSNIVPILFLQEIISAIGLQIYSKNLFIYRFTEILLTALL